MLDLSGLVISEILAAFKDLEIGPAQLPVNELRSVVDLLKELQMNKELEWLLTELWSSSGVQGSWSTRDVTWFGQQLVGVRFSLGNRDSAVALCEDMMYNLRTVKGSLDQSTNETSTQLLQLYTTTGRQDEATALQKNMRQGQSGSGDLTDGEAALTTNTHLDLPEQARSQPKQPAKLSKKSENESERHIKYGVLQRRREQGLP
ncbi:MAG: hypothetical protein Q9160_009275 [Pyrenula sp. 1 TL-2023]